MFLYIKWFVSSHNLFTCRSNVSNMNRVDLLLGFRAISKQNNDVIVFYFIELDGCNSNNNLNFISVSINIAVTHKARTPI